MFLFPITRRVLEQFEQFFLIFHVEMFPLEFFSVNFLLTPLSVPPWLLLVLQLSKLKESLVWLPMLSWSRAFPRGSKGYKDKRLKLFIMHWLLILYTSLIVAHLQSPSQEAAMVDCNSKHSSLSERCLNMELGQNCKIFILPKGYKDKRLKNFEKT